MMTLYVLALLDITKMVIHALRAPFAGWANIRQEHRVVAVVVLTHKRVRRAPPVADRANTKQDQRVRVVPLAIHKVVLLVRTVGYRILARQVNI